MYVCMYLSSDFLESLGQFFTVSLLRGFSVVPISILADDEVVEERCRYDAVVFGLATRGRNPIQDGLG